MIVKNRACLWREKVDGVVNNPFYEEPIAPFP